MIQTGDIVVIVNSNSIPEVFLGCYGKVTAGDDPFKVVVELRKGIGTHGSLSHTAFPSDLKVVGRTATYDGYYATGSPADVHGRDGDW